MSWATGYTPGGYGLVATVVTLTYLWLPYMIIPVFAAFERVPNHLVDASSDLGASDFSTLRMVVAPLVFPGIAAGSIFTFSLSLGDYIAVTIVGGKTQMLGNIIYGQLVTANNQPLAAALSIIPLVAVILYLLAMRRTGAWRTSDVVRWSSHGGPGVDRPGAGVPLCATASRRRQRVQRVAHLRLPAERFHPALVGRRLEQRRDVDVAGQFRAGRTRCHGDRLVLGTMIAFAVQRHRFFGRNAISFLVVLPITLPGIVTGIALNATFTSALGGVTLGLATVIVGHATFCIVIVFNNTQARLRRLGTDLEDASADLGGASSWQTFRFVTFPMMRGALVAGAILAFALSFDEIVVTTFTAGGPAVQTLPHLDLREPVPPPTRLP